MEGKLLDTNLLKRLEGLKINSDLKLNSGYGGGRKSRSKGSSVEFSDFREYVTGDDFRKIDWNAYGRFDKLFVKLFMEEREALVNIFLDTSKSMDFGQPSKSMIEKQLALTLSYISLSNLDRINLYINKDSSLVDTGYISGKSSFPRLLRYLEDVTFEEREDLFELIKKKPFKRGISIIISDLFTDSFEDIVKYLSYMNQSIIVIQILSKEELKPEIQGDIRLIDSESEEGKDMSISGEVINTYHKTLNYFLGDIKETCKKYGCSHTLISSETPIDSIVFHNLVKAGILR